MLTPELVVTDVGAIDSISGLARVRCLTGTMLNLGVSEAICENILFEHREEGKITDLPTRLSRLSSK